MLEMINFLPLGNKPLLTVNVVEVYPLFGKLDWENLGIPVCIRLS